jgi:hypothetical protein
MHRMENITFHKKCFSYFRKNVTCPSVGLLLMCQVFTVPCTIVWSRLGHCCFMSDRFRFKQTQRLSQVSDSFPSNVSGQRMKLTSHRHPLPCPSFAELQLYKKKSLHEDKVSSSWNVLMVSLGAELNEGASRSHASYWNRGNRITGPWSVASFLHVHYCNSTERWKIFWTGKAKKKLRTSLFRLGL